MAASGSTSKRSRFSRAKARSPRPVGVGPLAAVRAMSFAFHTQTLPGGEAGPADFSVDFTVKAPFYFYRQRQTTRLDHWRPAGG